MPAERPKEIRCSDPSHRQAVGLRGVIPLPEQGFDRIPPLRIMWQIRQLMPLHEEAPVRPDVFAQRIRGEPKVKADAPERRILVCRQPGQGVRHDLGRHPVPGGFGGRLGQLGGSALLAEPPERPFELRVVFGVPRQSIELLRRISERTVGFDPRFECSAANSRPCLQMVVCVATCLGRRRLLQRDDRFQHPKQVCSGGGPGFRCLRLGKPVLVELHALEQVLDGLAMLRIVGHLAQPSAQIHAGVLPAWAGHPRFGRFVGSGISLGDGGGLRLLLTGRFGSFRRKIAKHRLDPRRSHGLAIALGLGRLRRGRGLGLRLRALPRSAWPGQRHSAVPTNPLLAGRRRNVVVFVVRIRERRRLRALTGGR